MRRESATGVSSRGSLSTQFAQVGRRGDVANRRQPDIHRPLVPRRRDAGGAWGGAGIKHGQGLGRLNRRSSERCGPGRTIRCHSRSTREAFHIPHSKRRPPGARVPRGLIVHSPSAASSMTAATSFAWTTREAWLPATSVVWALILAANILWASGAMTLSFVLIT
jgi:hypothetical protein